MVSNTVARLPMLELGGMCVRSLRLPRPNWAAVLFRRSRSRQWGRSHISRQASNAATISTLIAQYSTFMSSGSGGMVSLTANCSLIGELISVIQPHSPRRTTDLPCSSSCSSAGV